MTLAAQAGAGTPGPWPPAYGHAFRTAFATRTTVGRNVNVLHHCLGMLSGGHLDPARRTDLLDVIARCAPTLRPGCSCCATRAGRCSPPR